MRATGQVGTRASMSLTRSSPSRDFAAVIVAAGSGTRAGQTVPKQFAPWRGNPLLRHSVRALHNAGAFPIVIPIPPGFKDLAIQCLAGIEGLAFVEGGATRQQSVAISLQALAKHTPTPTHVLIHDAARPIVPQSVIDRLLEALGTNVAAIPVLPIVDSLANAQTGFMVGKADREALRRVQTPQAFHFAEILAAHRAWRGSTDAGDDAQVMHAAGHAVALIEGDEAMRKITFAEDFMETQSAVRMGTGYDVHRLAAGEELWLGGIRIEHDHGLAGHSDADVAIHAIVDALLGAVAAGDIGAHFPPSDSRWRGAASAVFLAHAVSLVESAGYRVGNVDVTIICEAPRIGAHREAMRGKLASIMNVDIKAVSVKATTTEKLGFTGRGEGIAAQAVATVIRAA